VERTREAVLEPTPGVLIDGVDLVQDDLDGELARPDLGQHGLNSIHHLAEHRLRCGRVGDVEHEIRDERLLEGCSEPFDELVGQAADEADRVSDEVGTALVLERSCGRIERLEQPVVDGRLGAGKSVEERRLTDVRVAGESDRRRLGTEPGLPALTTLFREITQSSFEHGDATPRQPTVGLELALAGSPSPHPATESFEVLPHTSHARQVVLELGQFDLELALGGDRVLGEDVENELGAIDDPRFQRVLETALLRRSELVVDDQHLGVRLCEGGYQLLQLALADVRSRIGVRPVLDELADRLQARCAGQLVQLGELGCFTRRQEAGDGKRALPICPWRRIRLVVGHSDIMRLRSGCGENG